MSHFNLRIETNNDAFYGTAVADELARILRETADRLERSLARRQDCTSANLYDINGNHVGEFIYDGFDEDDECDDEY